MFCFCLVCLICIVPFPVVVQVVILFVVGSGSLCLFPVIISCVLSDAFVLFALLRFVLFRSVSSSFGTNVLCVCELAHACANAHM